MSLRKKKAEPKTLSDKISDLLLPRPLLDPEVDADDETVARARNFDEDGDPLDSAAAAPDVDLPLSAIRKNNVRMLQDVDGKYSGRVASRRDLDEYDELGYLDSDQDDNEDDDDEPKRRHRPSGLHFSDEEDAFDSDDDDEDDEKTTKPKKKAAKKINDDSFGALDFSDSDEIDFDDEDDGKKSKQKRKASKKNDDSLDFGDDSDEFDFDDRKKSKPKKGDQKKQSNAAFNVDDGKSKNPAVQKKATKPDDDDEDDRPYEASDDDAEDAIKRFMHEMSSDDDFKFKDDDSEDEAFAKRAASGKFDPANSFLLGLNDRSEAQRKPAKKPALQPMPSFANDSDEEEGLKAKARKPDARLNFKPMAPFSHGDDSDEADEEPAKKRKQNGVKSSAKAAKLKPMASFVPDEEQIDDEDDAQDERAIAEWEREFKSPAVKASKAKQSLEKAPTIKSAKPVKSSKSQATAAKRAKLSAVVSESEEDEEDEESEESDGDEEEDDEDEEEEDEDEEDDDDDFGDVDSELEQKSDNEDDEDDAGAEDDEQADDEEAEADDDDESDDFEDGDDIDLAPQMAKVAIETGDVGESTVETEGVALTGRTTHESAELQKGHCVQNQLHIWEKLLEMRIHSQKFLIGANSLPRHDRFAALIDDAPDDGLAEAARLTQRNVSALLERMTELQRLLFAGFAETKQLARDMETGRPGRKRAHDGDARGQQLADAFDGYREYRNAVLLKWHDRTRVLTPGSKEGRQAVQHNVLQSIDAVLLQRGDLVRKSQTHKGGYTMLGEVVAPPPAVADDADADPVEPVYYPEIYDDSDFYHTQLRELIEFKANATTNPDELSRQFAELQKLRRKMKKVVDTRASKGRKIRYAVHKKMVNFMARHDPSEWTDEGKTELYASLFGAKNV